MHTVYIKYDNGLVNADRIESIRSEDNKVYLNTTILEDLPFQYRIYDGKAINIEDAKFKVLSAINQAKISSSKEEKAIILDFLEDLDKYMIYPV